MEGRGRLVRWVAKSRARFTRYTVASLVATGLSQLVLYGLYSSAMMGAAAASAVAFAAGAVPHFVMIRWWAWGQRGMPRLSRQVVGYLVVTALGGLVSVALTTVADWAFQPWVVDRASRTLVLNLTYVLGGLPVFVAKFAFLDRVFAPGYDEYVATNSTRVRAANPVAPGTTSS
ncbi:GtrA family protein [Alloactinosynnema sp. L-07]|uniref:GtrA family protein n=1 Tax=Alloactinosynnema sp. L-07 TaxID=1653480 RepID=UPI0006B41BB3|nr:GtrA family protein [Alloactinosynnema sp. L-07]